MYYFHPNDKRCKSKTGGVQQNETFVLRLMPLHPFLQQTCQHADQDDFSQSEVAANLQTEFGGEQERISVIFTPDSGGEQVAFAMTRMRDGSFQTTCSLQNAGLYFYRFVQLPSQIEIHTLDDPAASPNPGSHRQQDKSRDEHPLLVTDGAFSAPKWVQGGIMYQIFPDRFCKTGQVNEAAAKNVRTIHKTTTERPLFVQDDPNYQATDFFGGTLQGITEKLPYLQTLGVTILYLNPIFEAASNHRYNTGDYLQVDPFLGTNEDFEHLCKAAHDREIRVILDGVFSHTGSDSRYFNKDGHYDTLGAWQSPNSPYASWYSFGQTRDDYACWWGFKTLPNVKETDPAYMEFICGKDGVLRHWLRLGADGWRLDVADELPDVFLEAVRTAIKAEKPDALLVGEVWENAALKHSYGARRAFLQGRQLDGVMNYPWRNAIVDAILQKNPQVLADSIWELQNTYPGDCMCCNMNLLGTHDTPRILTALAGLGDIPKDWQPEYRMTAAAYATAVARLRLAAGVQYFLPGFPSIYYGDEAGMEGFADPWNRRCFPWGARDLQLTAFAEQLGHVRHRLTRYFAGDFCCTLVDAKQATPKIQNSSPGFDGRKLLLLTYSLPDETLSLLFNCTDTDFAYPVPDNANLLLCEGGAACSKHNMVLPAMSMAWMEEQTSNQMQQSV